MTPDAQQLRKRLETILEDVTGYIDCGGERYIELWAKEEKFYNDLASLIEVEKRAAIEEAVPKIMQIVFNNENILIKDGVDELEVGKQMARDIYNTLFPPTK